MCLSFALALWWSLVFSAGLGFVLVPLMDPDWSWGAGWRRRRRRRRRAAASDGGGMETEAQRLWPPGGGVGGRKCRAAGEVGAPVQVSGSPSSLTNFEIDLRPPFPRCTGAQAKEGLVSSSGLTPAFNYRLEQSCYLIKPPYKTISLIVSFARCRYKLAH